MSAGSEELVELDENSVLLGTHWSSRSTGLFKKGYCFSKECARDLLTWENFKILLCFFVTVIAVVSYTAVNVVVDSHLIACSADSYWEEPIMGMRSDLVGIRVATAPAFAPPKPTNGSVAHTLIFSVWGVSPKTKTKMQLANWNATTLLSTEVAFHHVFDLNLSNYETEWENYTARIETDSDISIGVGFQVLSLHKYARHQVLFSALILILMYALILFEWLHSTLAAMICAFLAIGTYSQLYVRPSLSLVVSRIDFETLGLLFGMMILVGIFSSTGFFEWISVKTYKISRGNLWVVMVLLCIMTALSSAVLDNVTTMLLIGPVTIKLCKILDIPPKLIILSEILFSNLGGTATIIGNPPNVIIASNRYVEAEGITFLKFFIHVSPPLFLITGLTFLYLWRLYRKANLSRDPNLSLKTDILTMKHTYAVSEEPTVKAAIQKHISELQEQLENSHPMLRTISELEKKYVITNVPMFLISTIIILATLFLFLMHSLMHISLAWIALGGAMLLILLSGIEDIDEVLSKVGWGTLIFMASLFVLMGMLEDLGLIAWITQEMANLILLVPTGSGRLSLACVLVIWVSGIATAFLDSLPTTTTLLPIVVELSNTVDLPLRPLIWSLSLGVGLGSVSTVIGSPVNVIGIGILEQMQVSVSFGEFWRFGAPVGGPGMVIVTAYILLCVLGDWW